MTRISNLFRLQSIDSQLDTIRTRQNELNAWLKDESALDLVRRQEEKAAAELQEARQEVRRTEEVARSQQQKIADTDKTLYGGGVRNPKELQDLQQEVVSLQRHLGTLEERQLQAMVHSDEANAAMEAATGERQAEENLREQKSATIRSELDSLGATMEKVLLQREAALAAVAEADLEQYQTLRKSKRGLAVARFEAGACTGCGVAPSTSRVDSARSGQDIVQCGNCGRILYLG